MAIDLDGAVALVTGGANGIGSAAAQSLLAELPRPIRARANLEFNVLVDFMDSQV